ncbi:MAG: hypothetical protein ACK502_09200 [Alphaproteobacteria bacterium]|jgi:hypothetical protein
MSEKLHKNRQSLDDLTHLSQMARKMMARLDELLDTPQKDDAEHLGGRNSLVSALNTLTGLVLALEARERVLLEGSADCEEEKPLPLSEADIALLEQFLSKQQ